MILRRFGPAALKNFSKLNSASKNSFRAIKLAVGLSALKRSIPTFIATPYFQFATQRGNQGPNTNKNIQLVKTIEEFQRLIKENNIPIVLDCFANWCEPCRKLTPILEKKTTEAQGKWILAKFDIDEIPQLASALKLRSVPTVILIHGANVIDSFEGYPTEEVSNTFFATVDKLCGMTYSEEEHRKIYNEAIGLIEAKKFSEAIVNLKKLQEQEQWIERYGGQTVAALALSFIKSGDKNAAIQCLQELKAKYEGDLEKEEVKILVQQVEKEFQQKDSDSSKLEQMKEELEKDPENNDLRLQIAQYAIDNGIYDQAIETLLDILKIDRNYNNRIANTLLLEIFGKLGSTNPLVIQGRKKMQKILY